MSKRTFATAFPGARSAREEVEDESASELEDDMLEGDSDVEEMMAAGVLPGVTTTEAAAKMLPNNIAGLQQAFARLHDDVDWIHRLEIVSADSLVGADVNDDLKLEMAFYGQALAAAMAARSELERLGVPHYRPDDFFAEMMKSDEHMKKIKDKLVFEQKKMSAVDARRKEKSASLYAKQAAAAKVKAKSADKRTQMDALKQWRKHKEDMPDLSTDADLENMFASAKHAASKAEGKAKPGMARRNKDRKFGHGGSKRMRKENTAGSSASMKDFSMRRNRTLPTGMKSKASKPRNAGASRPGKSARMAKRGGGGGGRK